jgi:ferric-dicitrate binding protein FerR (iron transport regulator)
MSDMEHGKRGPEGGEPARPDSGRSPQAGQEPSDGFSSSQDQEIARLLHLAGPRESAHPERVERVRSAVHARWRAEVRARRRRWIPWIAVPAAAAAGVAVFFLLAPRLRAPSPGAGASSLAVLERLRDPVTRGGGVGLKPGEEIEPGSEISTGAEGRAALRLASGASLRLDGGTTLRLVSGALLDLERGAVYIDSGEATDARVAVHTPSGTIRDVGTQFVVRLGEAGLVVAVREGSASLSREGGVEEISAGTRLTAGPGGAISRAPVASYGPDWDWVMEIAPPFMVENRTLGEFLAWVSRETGRQVRFSDPGSAQERASIILHGSLAGLRPDQAPAAILPTCGLKSRLEGDVFIIEAEGAAGGPP